MLKNRFSRACATTVAFTITLITLLVAAGITALPAAAADPPITQRSATGVTADALPTAQINGVVWDQAIVNNTVYAGGQFTSARPAGADAGTSETPRIQSDGVRHHHRRDDQLRPVGERRGQGARAVPEQERSVRRRRLHQLSTAFSTIASPRSTPRPAP